MNSIAVKNAISSPFYAKRANTDELFNLPSGSVKIEGILDQTIRFIENYQLLDPKLWKKFVDQYRSTDPKADDETYGWRGEYWGKMMRGACFTYQYTQNPKLYACLEETVRDMMTAQDELGRISSYSVEKQYDGWDLWCRKYVLLGMQYFIEICKDEKLISEITDCMRRQADYLCATLGHEEGKKEITDASRNWNGLNSSSILEPIVRLYDITKEQKYLDFATYIISCGGTKGENIFELAAEGKLYPYQYKVTKAYEMMSCFEGLLEYYRVTGIEKWKKAAVNLANLVADSDITVIGSAGCTHELFDHSRVHQLTTKYFGVMQETCVTVTWLKFCNQALCISGDSRFADEMERAVYNAMLGSINYDKHSGNGGFPFDSYSPLLFNTRLTGVGGCQVMSDGSSYGCCACIGSAGTGIIPKFSAMLRKDGIALNLYAPQCIDTQTPMGNALKLDMATDYPLTGKIKVTLGVSEAESFTVALRIPYWSKRTMLKINGENVNTECGAYAVCTREWKNGDVIELELDMRCEVIYPDSDEYADENSKYHVSLRRGPLALARDSRLPGNIEDTVEFAPDEEGYVPCEISNAADFEHFYGFAVTMKNGNKLEMVDYPSAGRTWDERSMTTVWLPTKNYWSVDLTKPVTVICPSFWSDNGEWYLSENEDHTFSVNQAKGSAVILEVVENGYYRIRMASGRYIDVNDQNALVTTENGCKWKLQKFVQNRYRIITENGMRIRNENAPNTPLIVEYEEGRPQPAKYILKLENV